MIVTFFNYPQNFIYSGYTAVSGTSVTVTNAAITTDSIVVISSVGGPLVQVLPFVTSVNNGNFVVNTDPGSFPPITGLYYFFSSDTPTTPSPIFTGVITTSGGGPNTGSIVAGNITSETNAVVFPMYSSLLGDAVTITSIVDGAINVASADPTSGVLYMYM